MQPNKPYRTSHRLRGFDYSWPEAYYVTICTHQKRCLFGTVRDDEVHLNHLGEIVQAEWLKTAQLRPEVKLREFTIMPNHIHVLIAFRNTQGESINSIVGSGKCFMAYDIIKRLRKLGKFNVLRKLERLVNKKEKLKGKLHEIFEPSFDWKMCDTENLVDQKLDYIHENPCRGKWQLCQQLEDYVHSSACFYAIGKQGVYEVTNIAAIEDIDLTKPFVDNN